MSAATESAGPAGGGWIDGLPQSGLGASDGWLALMAYCNFVRVEHGVALASRRVTQQSTPAGPVLMIGQ
jgi:hypothetical protein